MRCGLKTWSTGAALSPLWSVESEPRPSPAKLPPGVEFEFWSGGTGAYSATCPGFDCGRLSIEGRPKTAIRTQDAAIASGVYRRARSCPVDPTGGGCVLI